MTPLLGATLIGGAVALVLCLIGWTRVMSHTSTDTTGVGPLKKKEPFDFPERAHYQMAAEEIRTFRKQWFSGGRKREWRDRIIPKLEGVAEAFPDETGTPMVLPERADYPQLIAALDELERRAELAPMRPQSTHVTPAQPSQVQPSEDRQVLEQ